MDWSIVLDYAWKAFVSLASGVIVTYASILFAKLRAKIGDVRLKNFIGACARAAEQLFPNTGTKTGPEKFNYVLEQVLKKYPKLANNEYLRAMIESEVFKISEEVKQIAKEQSKIESSSNNTSITSF